MVAYSQKDVRIKINDADLFCTSATIKYDVAIQPVYSLLAKNSFAYAPMAPPKGAFDITYYLTGADPLAQNIINERDPISLFFNGLLVNSGYLASYSFDCKPFSNVEIKASLKFFEKIQGDFTESQSPLPDVDPLSVSDISLENGSLIKESNITNISYSYESASLTPEFVIEENFNNDGPNLHGVVSKEKKISSQFSLYDYDLSLPVSGQHESFKFNFKDKNNISRQAYDINGFITNKSVGAKTEDRTISNYSLIQSNLGGKLPSISSISPPSGGLTGTVTLNGNNFLPLDQVLLGEFPCEVQSKTDTSVVITTSPDILSGYKAPIRIVTTAGDSLSSTGYHVTGGANYL